jgi:hypothetical protein
MLKSVFAILDPTDITQTSTLSDFFYKRALGDEYTIPLFFSDAASAASEFLEM